MKELKQQTRLAKYAITTIKLCLALIVVFVLAQAIQLLRHDDPRIGEQLLLQDIDISGIPIDLQQYHGQPVMLYFWGSWCPICQFKYGLVSSIAEDYPVVTVAIQSGTASEVLQTLREAEAKFSVINDPDSHLAQQFDIRGVPTTMLLDSQGRVSRVMTGYTSEPLLRFLLWRLTDE